MDEIFIKVEQLENSKEKIEMYKKELDKHLNDIIMLTNKIKTEDYSSDYNKDNMENKIEEITKKIKLLEDYHNNCIKQLDKTIESYTVVIRKTEQDAEKLNNNNTR